MQKKLIALALASLAGSAFAQSNVTIYGVADGTFEIAKASGATGNGADRNSFTRFNSNSSLIGFKGAEDLGNGLKAVFQFENGINIDAGGWGGTRDTFVGLSGNWGTVVGGNLTGPTRALGSAIDMNAGATGPGAYSSLVGKPLGGTGAGALDTRLPNTVAYVSPNFSGFTAVIGYMSGENKTNDLQIDALKANLKAVDAGLTYANGPVMVGLTYADVEFGTKDAASAATVNSWKNTRLAGTYTFNGGHKIGALYDHAKLNFGQGGDLTRNTWGVFGKFMVTQNGGLIAQYFDARKPSGDFYADNNQRGAKLYEIGYEHSLSKRTMLKASYSAIKNQDRADFDFNVGGTQGTGATSWGAGANPQVFAVGVRHSF